jgi:ribose-phosphate pyrophosphokinase
VASPDIGGVKRAQLFRERLQQRLGREVELAFIEKRRAGGTAASGRIVGDVTGREVILLDDLCASGGTLIRGATVLREAGARAVHATFTHAPMAAGLAALAAADAISSLIFTDSAGAALQVPVLSGNRKLHVLEIAPLFAQALKRMSAGAPLAPVLESWPPTDSS